jgi:hypothetical protein
MAKKCARVHPLRLPLVDEPQVQLADQRRRLQRVALPLAREEPLRLLVQLRIDELHQLVLRARVTVAPGAQRGRHACVRHRGRILDEAATGADVLP